MKAFVTGATGFVGSHVARVLAEQGADLRLLVRSTSDPKNIQGLNADRVIGDLRDSAALEEAASGSDVIFHVAADYRLWIRDPDQMYRSNVEGTRAIINVTGGRVEGARVRGSLVPPSGEWAYIRADGSVKADVRALIRTDDGATILMTYNGIGQLTDSGSTIRSAPLFEVGDPRYAWLNRIQAIGIGGRTGEGRVVYLAGTAKN